MVAPLEAADRLPVHPADDAEERPGMWNAAHDVVSLVGQCRTVAVDETDSIGPGVQTELTQPRRCNRRRPRVIGLRIRLLAIPPDGGMFPEGCHRSPFSCIYGSVSFRTGLV